jgi:drug/metabolite transporter (DMT)-like permease
MNRAAPSDTSDSSAASIRVPLALFAVYVLWGSTYLAMQVGLSGFPPLRMAATRFLLAGSLLYGFLRARGQPDPGRRGWGASAVCGCLMLTMGNGGVIYAEQWVQSGLAALMIASVPLWAALFAGLLGRWPSKVEWLGLFLGAAGVLLLNLEGNLQASPAGALALIVASVCWALGSVLSGRLPLPRGLMASATQMLCGGSVLLCLSFLRGERLVQVPAIRPLLALLYLVVFGSLVGYSAYLYLLTHVRPALATSYAFVNPVIAVILGALFANERITARGVLAMVVILSGVVLVLMVRARTAPRKPAGTADLDFRPPPSRPIP